MRQRSSYPKPFKAQVVQECLQPGATISSVAIHHGINANVIRKWLPTYRDQSVTTLPAFVPVKPAPKRATEETVCWRRRRIDPVAEISLTRSDSSRTTTFTGFVLT
jgi:transposase-like protein